MKQKNQHKKFLSFFLFGIKMGKKKVFVFDRENAIINLFNNCKRPISNDEVDTKK